MSHLQWIAAMLVALASTGAQAWTWCQPAWGLHAALAKNRRGCMVVFNKEA